MIEAYKIALLQPVKINSDFGTRTDPKTGKRGVTHYGLDLVSTNSNSKKQIFAVADGVVLSVVTNQSKSTTGYGNTIWIRHKDLGWSSFYAHLKTVNVKKGDVIKQGQVIGIMGSTGKSTGDHLHFGIQYIGSSKWQDPKKFKVPYIQVTPTVKRDESKNQIKVITTQLRVRTDHSTSSTIVGISVKNGIYNYSDIYKTSKYTWYKIANNQWIANDGKWLEIYPKKEDEDKMLEEIKKELEVEKEKNKLLDAKNKEWEKKYSNLEKTLDSFKKIYDCKLDKEYRFKIKLYKGESLYIK